MQESRLPATVITVRTEAMGDALTCSECKLYVYLKGDFSGWKFCPGYGAEITRFDREEPTAKMVYTTITNEPQPTRLNVHIAGKAVNTKKGEIPSIK
jgi:hypothetical protein